MGGGSYRGGSSLTVFVLTRTGHLEGGGQLHHRVPPFFEYCRIFTFFSIGISHFFSNVSVVQKMPPCCLEEFKNVFFFVAVKFVCNFNLFRSLRFPTPPGEAAKDFFYGFFPDIFLPPSFVPPRLYQPVSAHKGRYPYPPK